MSGALFREGAKEGSTVGQQGQLAPSSYTYASGVGLGRRGAYGVNPLRPFQLHWVYLPAVCSHRFVFVPDRGQ